MHREGAKMRSKIKNTVGEHRKNRYDECYAKVLLENMFPNEYSHLVLADKPDLINENLNIGIEVTGAVPETLKEAQACWIKAFETEKISTKNKYIKRMEQLGYKYTGGIQCWNKDGSIESYEETSLADLQNIIQVKIEKMNTCGYRILKHMDLYVSVMYSLMSVDIDNIYCVIKDANNGRITFRNIIINVIEDNTLVLYEMSSGKYRVESYDNQQYGYAVRANDMTEEEVVE